ncbi:MAG: hypothetical protein JRN20_13775 [Nitrososphaerota archaeon]|nr:hypothetical protein [Nitrososphaerota archaeon]
MFSFPDCALHHILMSLACVDIKFHCSCSDTAWKWKKTPLR